MRVTGNLEDGAGRDGAGGPTSRGGHRTLCLQSACSFFVISLRLLLSSPADCSVLSQYIDNEGSLNQREDLRSEK